MKSSASSKISSRSRWLTNMLNRPGKIAFVFASASVLALTLGVAAQQGQPQIGIAAVTLSAGPYTFDTAEQHKIRVVVVARGLVHPFSLAFLPDGDALITERGTKLRIVRNATGPQATVDPEAVAGLPAFPPFRTGGLQEVALHPQFATNRLVYFTYNKAGAVDRTRTSDRAPSRLRADDSTARR